MKTYIMLVLVAFCGLGRAFDDKFEHFDMDKILEDDKLLNAYADCLLDKDPCEGEITSFYKRIIPEAVEHGCVKCTSKQAQNIKKIILALKERLPAKYKEFEQKYDINGEDKQKFALFMSTPN